MRPAVCRARGEEGGTARGARRTAADSLSDWCSAVGKLCSNTTMPASEAYVRNDVCMSAAPGALAAAHLSVVACAPRGALRTHGACAVLPRVRADGGLAMSAGGWGGVESRRVGAERVGAGAGGGRAHGDEAAVRSRVAADGHLRAREPHLPAGRRGA